MSAFDLYVKYLVIYKKLIMIYINFKYMYNFLYIKIIFKP